MLRLTSGLAAVCLASVTIVAPVTMAAAGEAFSNGTSGSSGPVRGVVRAVHQATISTDSPLLAVELAFREGDRFRRGASLAVFDCRRQKSELDAALQRNARRPSPSTVTCNSTATRPLAATTSRSRARGWTRRAPRSRCSNGGSTIASWRRRSTAASWNSMCACTSVPFRSGPILRCSTTAGWKSS